MSEASAKERVRGEEQKTKDVHHFSSSALHVFSLKQAERDAGLGENITFKGSYEFPTLTFDEAF